MTATLQILQSKLRAADARRAEIEVLLEREPRGSYQRQELESEAAELLAVRRACDFKIRALKDLPPAPDARRQKIIDAEVNALKTNLLEWIAELERQGDYRNARLWRRELLNLREVVEREFP